MKATETTALLWCVLLACACGDDEGGGGAEDDPDASTDADADMDTDVDECTETAGDELPDGLTEIAWDDGEADSTVADTPLGQFDINGSIYVIGEEPMWEAVRFDIPSPGLVHGFRVQWGNLLGEGVRPVGAGLHADFGSNGFDFYQWEPLWSGDRCLSEDEAGEWVDYALDEPVEIDVPGPIFVAHFWETQNDPAFLFESGLGSCEGYDDCHSAINMPQAEAGTFYNGLSASLAIDYAVRLLVELEDPVPAEDKWFRVDEALTASSRAAWGDYDGDGDDDLMTNGPVLWRNEGDGTFSDVTAEAGLEEVVAASSGGVWGDYDNDGCLDYFGQSSSKTEPDILLHNECDGTFGDVTLESGIWDTQDYLDCVEDLDEEHAPTEGSAWFDLDADGLLDLYMAQYECGGVYENYVDRVWHNEGDGTFTEWTDDHGFAWATMHAGRGVSPADFDLDGDVDLLVSNYRLDPNFMFVNQGDGTVSDLAEFNGLAGENVSGSYGHTIGSVWLDLENDGDFDLFQANLAHPRFYHFSDLSRVMVNDGQGDFTDNREAAGIFYRETHSNPTSADFDNDGDADLFITCVYEGRFSEMYLNDGGGVFQQVNYQSGAVVHGGWGSAAADYDGDGDVDLVAGELLRNDTAAGDNHWLQVRALGGESSAGTVNAAGIGSVVRVTAGGSTAMQQTSGGSGTGCQDSQVLHFGLGSATEADAIDVIYPGGATVHVDGPIAADQRVWISADGSVD
ncbi:MAG: CRTAC1 family protein [Polyangia bacterium]